MAATTDADARGWDYTTFAPEGKTCPRCRKQIKSLERCRRVTAGPLTCR